MYRILGADGREYGPANLDQMREWIGQGRVNAQTRVQAEGSPEWRNASEIPELQAFLANPAAARAVTAASSQPPAPATKPRQGMAVTSFVLGLLAILCFGVLTGLPAIITGHLAHGRARRNPAQFGGAGFAIAGFVMGYVSILITLVALAVLLPALAKAKSKATEIRCMNNLRQIGLAHQMFAMDHDELFPFSVSNDAGGTLEQVKTDDEGFATDPAPHLKALAQQLSSGPTILVCPADRKPAAESFDELQSANISYRLRAVPGIETNLTEVLAACPIHDNILRPDGSVHNEK